MVALSEGKKKAGKTRPVLSLGALVLCLAALLVSCGGGGSDDKGYSYTVRGVVYGMIGGGLILQNNGADDLLVNANGTFTFPKAIANGATYNVTIKTQPATLSQTCTVSNATGVINTKPVGNVIISCVPPPPRLLVEPSGRFVYAANYAAGNISAYAIDAASGALTPVAGSPFAAGAHPNSLSIDPAGQFLYTANITTGNISAYTIDAATGILAEVAGSPFAAGTLPYAVTIDPTGTFAYAANITSGDISAYAIDAATGILTEVAGSPFAAGTQPFALTIDPTGQFAYATNSGSKNISVCLWLQHGSQQYHHLRHRRYGSAGRGRRRCHGSEALHGGHASDRKLHLRGQYPVQLDFGLCRQGSRRDVNQNRRFSFCRRNEALRLGRRSGRKISLCGKRGIQNDIGLRHRSRHGQTDAGRRGRKPLSPKNPARRFAS
jgi:hypothetical protein